jgi:sulfate permease, SulP family
MRPATSRLRGIAPEKRWFKQDALAGIPSAIGSVPDGMASGILAGVSPVHGLYASFAGPIAGGLTASTRLMVITTTSAAALAAGSGISHLEGDARARALVLLTIVAGAFMVVAGVLKLGRYTRFVSHSVMLGFLTGIGVNIICGQLGDLTGMSAEGSINLTRAFDVLTHPGDWDIPSLLTGLGALALLVVLARTRVAIVSALIALVIPTVVVLIAGLESVIQVEDGGDIPSGFPVPELPQLSDLSLSVIAAAAAVAAIVLVQGAGVAESAPNVGIPTNANQDFVAQGAGNLAAGVFGGMPVGGSVGQTALNVTAGGRTRWASILSGVWMLVILVAFSGAVGKVAMPTLAAILIYAGYSSLRPAEIMTILRTGPTSRIAVISTFIATLTLPVAAAVGLGVVISLLLQLNQEAMDLAVVSLVPIGDGKFEEHPAPTHLESNAVTTFDVYGSLFYAGARTLQAQLPDPLGTERPVVVIRLRGRTTLGATFFSVASDYSRKLRDVGGRLYLTGLDPALVAHMRSSDPLAGTAMLYSATRVVGASTQSAIDDASAWLVGTSEADDDHT